MGSESDNKTGKNLKKKKCRKFPQIMSIILNERTSSEKYLSTFGEEKQTIKI